MFLSDQNTSDIGYSDGIVIDTISAGRLIAQPDTTTDTSIGNMQDTIGTPQIRDVPILHQLEPPSSVVPKIIINGVNDNVSDSLGGDIPISAGTPIKSNWVLLLIIAAVVIVLIVFAAKKK
jgi:hypothetical protein